MRNSISHIFREPGRRVRFWASSRDVDESPGLRLWTIYALMVLPVLGIMVRLAQVQLVLTPRYIAELQRTLVREESIPTLSGRIIGADGTLLARDVELFNLQAHYRWLEQPPNPLWTKQQARSRLSRADGRRKERVQEEERKFLLERDHLWQNIAEMAELTAENIATQRQRIQRQVEHIRSSVQKRQQTALIESRPDLKNASSWQKLWHLLGETLISASESTPEITRVVREERDYHLVLTDIPREMAIEIESHPETWPGLRITRSSRREYPAGSTASHIVGYRKQLNETEIAKRKTLYPEGDPLDYATGDWSGETGLEKFYESSLRGLRGLKRITLNWKGEIASEEIIRAPRPGSDLQISLHVPLQQQIESFLADLLDPQQKEIPVSARNSPTPPASVAKPPAPRGGCITIMDVRTGELIAAASLPHFNLQMMVEHDPEEWQRISADTRHPLFPRLTRMQIPPGSVFKTLTSIGLLELPGFNPDEEFHCQGYLTTPEKFRCLSFVHNGIGHDATDLNRAMAQSCNVYFFKLSPKLGRKNLSDWADRFGFGSPVGIDLPGESRGNLPRHKQLDLRGLAIGQGELLVTPLQIVRMMAAIANGGELVTPHLAHDVESLPRPIDSVQNLPASASHARHRSFPRTKISEVSPHTWERIQEALELVVAHPQGTAHTSLFMNDLKVAGKTGTAETKGNPDHAWFAGYFPADRPRYAIVTVLEQGGSGGRDAGPPTRKAIEAMLDLGLIQRSSNRTPQTTASEE